MSDASDWQHQLSQKYWQPSPHQTICSDCAFHVEVEGVIECIHPDESEINCSTVLFCNSFQSIQEVESPCVCFYDEQ
ncbi:hypothetical protein CEN40_14765 [Fischerella thermalis CCMEE 5205]|nr:hypothetical protein CEN40_14765 [Fischerella thermalis CCMEE 5205]